MQKLQAGLILLLIIFTVLSCNNNDNGCSLNPNINIQDETRHQNDIQTIDTFLENNDIVARTDTSGMRFVVNEQGSGEQPTLCDNVRVMFVGRILNGAVFQETSEPVDFDLTSLITGWQIGVPKIQEGGSITLYIPSTLAFGNQDRSGSGIPPNSIVVFEIDLLQIN